MYFIIPTTSNELKSDLKLRRKCSCQVLSCDVYVNIHCIEKISSSQLSPWTAGMTKQNLIVIAP